MAVLTVAEKYFTIKMGFTEPQQVERGEINRSTGLPASATEKGIAVVGSFAIPNYCKSWGVLHKTTENKPTGEFTPLPWGHHEGEVVELRYLRNCKSLVKLYQESLKLKPGEQDGFIMVNYGLNDFDATTHSSLVQFLRYHTFNGDSECRDPENRNVKYHEYDEGKMVAKSLLQHERKYEAMQLVMQLKDNPKKLRVLASVFELDPKKQDQVLITELMEFVNTNPGLFNDQRDYYTKSVQSVVLRARDFDLFNMDIPGEIHLVGAHKGPLITKINSKLTGNKKLEFLIENAFEPEVFDAFVKLKLAVFTREQELN